MKFFERNIEVVVGISLLIFIFLWGFNLKSFGASGGEYRRVSWWITDKPVGVVTMNIFGREFPVDYRWNEPFNFSFYEYYIALFFLIFGANYFVMKLATLVVSIILILASYYLISYLFNRYIAILTVILLSTDTLFIHYTRRGTHSQELYIATFFLCSLVFYILFRKYKKSIFLVLSGFVLGLGLSTKLSIFAFFFGVFCLMPNFLIRYNNYINIIFKRCKFYWKYVVLFIGSLMCGSILFIYYNVATEGKTFSLVKYFFSPTNLVDSTKSFNPNIRLGHLKTFISEELIPSVWDFPYIGIFKHMTSNVPREILWYMFLISLAFNFFYSLINLKKDKFFFNVFCVYILYFGIFL